MTTLLASITDPWELLEELGYCPMRVRATKYSRFIALTAKHPSAQQQMLVFEARRVFHVQSKTIRLDLE